MSDRPGGHGRIPGEQLLLVVEEQRLAAEYPGQLALADEQRRHRVDRLCHLGEAALQILAEALGEVSVEAGVLRGRPPQPGEDLLLRRVERRAGCGVTHIGESCAPV